MIAMIVCGVESGDEVITNGLTFTALPSTIMRLGATPVLVEATPNWTMDLDDLEKKAAAHPKAKVLVLSHMRGKIAHMDRVVEICEKHGLTLVEDCAHSCGVKWNGRQIGYHAAVSAYSTQSDKVINSGEGGFITSDDPEMMAKAIYLSGAYEARYKHHIAAPDAALCEDAMMKMPNLSSRMSELTAAVLRPLIANLPERVVKYNERYDRVVSKLRTMPQIVVPEQHPEVEGVGDHLNFYLKDVTKEQNAAFIATAKALGVPLGWFASKINARNHVNWRKFGSPTFELPNTDALLATAFDLKMPPHFTNAEMDTLADVLVYSLAAATAPPCDENDETCVDA
jgi:dTDP-4-amino-4,6-dideoxygalactose transaminase